MKLHFSKDFLYIFKGLIGLPLHLEGILLEKFPLSQWGEGLKMSGLVITTENVAENINSPVTSASPSPSKNNLAYESLLNLFDKCLLKRV